MIRFFCPTCNVKVQAPDDSAGRSGTCPKCAGAFTVPQFSMEPPPIPLPAGERPPTPTQAFPPDPYAMPSGAPVRPASPIEIFGPATPAPAMQAPAAEMTEEALLTEGEPVTASAAYIPPPPASFIPFIPGANQTKSPLPLILTVGGGLMVIMVVVVLAIGRKDPQTVAQDDSTNDALVQPEPRRPKIDNSSRSTPPVNLQPKPVVIPTTKPSGPQTVKNPSAPRTTGAQQPVFDPAPSVANPATRTVAAAKQIKTAAALLTPVQIEDRVYFVAKDGRCYVISADSSEVLEESRVTQGVQRLVREGKQLRAEAMAGNTKTVAEFDQPIDLVDPENVDPTGTATRFGGRTAPLKWHQHALVEKQVVLHNGKYYRPLTGGGMKVLEGTAIREFRTKMVGMNIWKIALLPSGPLGYDNTSVYELDENLCPVKRIINLDGDVGRWSTARINSSLASDGKTLCYVSAYNNKARMMIWSLDGKEKLREQTVTYNETITTEGKRLTALGAGYLFCGGELTWMPAGEGAPAQFMIGGPAAANTSAGRRRGGGAPPPPVRAGKVQNFTPPILAGDKLFVGHVAGNVYVFDSSAFAAAGEDGETGQATTNP